MTRLKAVGWDNVFGKVRGRIAVVIETSSGRDRRECRGSMIVQVKDKLGVSVAAGCEGLRWLMLCLH